VHLFVLKVGVGVFFLHDVRVEESLAVFYLADSEVSLGQFSQELRVADSKVVAYLSLEEGLAYLNTAGDFRIVVKLSFLDFNRFDLSLLLQNIDVILKPGSKS